MADDRNAETSQRDDTTSSANVLAQFTLLYESRDGRLCLFQDREGHLTSVDSARLA